MARTDAAKAGIDQALAMRRPEISFDTSGQLNHARRDPFGSDEPDKGYSYGLTMQVPIFQGGRETSALEVAMSQYRTSLESAKEVLTTTTLSLVSADAQIRRQDAIIAILECHRRALRQLRNNVVGERQAGTASSVDVGDVARQLMRLDIDRKQASLMRSDAKEALLRLNARSGYKLVSPDVVAVDLPAALPRVKEECKLGERTVYDEIRAIADAAQADTDVVVATYKYTMAQYVLSAETSMLSSLMGVKIDKTPAAGMSVVRV